MCLADLSIHISKYDHKIVRRYLIDGCSKMVVELVRIIAVLLAISGGVNAAIKLHSGLPEKVALRIRPEMMMVSHNADSAFF